MKNIEINIENVVGDFWDNEWSEDATNFLRVVMHDASQTSLDDVQRLAKYIYDRTVNNVLTYNEGLRGEFTDPYTEVTTVTAFYLDTMQMATLVYTGDGLLDAEIIEDKEEDIKL